MPPSERDRKYDRQLRLWAGTGQAALEASHVALLNASATGCELMKNLILPGVGEFTIIDDSLVKPDDLKLNFFFNDESVGSPRSVIACKLLGELNQDTRGHALFQNPEVLINDVDFQWDKFSVVIITNISESSVRKLSNILWNKSIPLIYVYTVGFYGYLRVINREITIVDTHPESLVDLRLDQPWPELIDYTMSFDLDSLPILDYAHVPFVVLILKFIDQWKSAHNGLMPGTYEERTQFKQLINDARKASDLENFDEALASVWRISQKTTIPPDILAILNDPSIDNLNEESPDFWVLVKALKRFTEAPRNNGLLPLSGVLFDMKADTNNYIRLQTIYREKSLADVHFFTELLNELLLELNRPSSSISSEEIKLFCKNCRYLNVTRGSKLDSEFSSEGFRSAYELAAFSENHDPFYTYLALRVYSLFLDKNWYYSENGKQITSRDDVELKNLFKSIITPFPTVPAVEKVFSEIIRTGSGEFHNICSFMGGIGAQEILKLLTWQYIPLNNTIIYDGIFGTTKTWKL
ncbi:hypothetical protein NADFUDRAFT_83652 [Nadsonia fulvescens var. elongata DSM 6958]|uniref:NEDD8-activating enzyme E1 regulatory subunit n=1 Tax=Nadsonia fulvescens var. elongata DSM 6958 TaxID=857566 RepID=A0A1E3PIK5_9ASCO|nr:hypothetical protein NADFUDRAFT_83652 [Nadsonia fulvescens var. elongata DSM 6958]